MLTHIRTWARRQETIRGTYYGFRRSAFYQFCKWIFCPRIAEPSVRELTHAISRISPVSGTEIDAAAPIFISSTGWRTGSTLIQRVLGTDSQLLLWGEPMGDMALVSRLAGMMSLMASAFKLEEFYISHEFNPTKLSSSWIANFYPDGDDFRRALRSLFDRWLANPAERRGFARWGFKEVRYGAVEAVLLRWLYPGAKFLVMTRHPYDCYRSLADLRWNHVYSLYPDLAVDSAAAFARHWNRLATSWSSLPAGFPYVVIKYEDLVSRRIDFRHLEEWLDLRINEEIALSASIGGSPFGGRSRWHERYIIATEANQGMRLLGYSK